jgi:protein TonB
MCPFKKAFPFVVLMHLLFVAGIIGAFAKHKTAEPTFTLMPVRGVGEELRSGEANVEKNESPKPIFTPVEPKLEEKKIPVKSAEPAPKIIPVETKTAESKINTVVEKVVEVAQKVSGSVAGNTPNEAPSAGGAMENGGAGGKIVPPIALKQPRPKHTGISGKVTLAFTVNKEGRVEEVRVENSPSAELTSAVMAVVPKWRFSPAQIAGKAIEIRVRQVVEF